MKSIARILKNIKNLSPYFLLIALYFIFINLEIRKENNNSKNIQLENRSSNDKSSGAYKEKLRISIPVIPYKQ